MKVLEAGYSVDLLGSATDLHDQLCIDVLWGHSAAGRHSSHCQVIAVFVGGPVPQLPIEQRPYVLLIADAGRPVPARMAGLTLVFAPFVYDST